MKIVRKITTKQLIVSLVGVYQLRTSLILEHTQKSMSEKRVTYSKFVCSLIRYIKFAVKFYIYHLLRKLSSYLIFAIAPQQKLYEAKTVSRSILTRTYKLSTIFFFEKIELRKCILTNTSACVINHKNFLKFN